MYKQIHSGVLFCSLYLLSLKAYGLYWLNLLFNETIDWSMVHHVTLWRVIYAFI